MPTPQESLLILNLIPGLGSVRIRALLDFFGSAELVLAAPMNLLQQVPRIGSKVASAILDWRNCTNLDRELELAAQFQVRLVSILDEEYPPALRVMHDPPIILYVRGGWIGDELKKSIAIVGARLATPYGINAARRFARELGDAGCSIISGLAKGIDAAAHWGALDAGAQTIGVLGSGQACFFPEENKDLARHMLSQGHSIVSEFPMSTRPSRTSFPQRNRIVAAWSQATLVAEAPLRSGSLHTARLAAEEYGRPVFALPGGIDRATSAGCHELIRDGAILAASPQHILQDMSWLPEAKPTQQSLFHTAQDQAHTPEPSNKIIPSEYQDIHHALQQGHDSLDQLCTVLAQDAHHLTSQLMRMQIAGLIRPLPGARYEWI